MLAPISPSWDSFSVGQLRTGGMKRWVAMGDLTRQVDETGHCEPVTGVRL